MHRFLTIKELSGRYNVCVATVYNWLKSGKLPAGLKIGGVRRWDITQLEAFEQRAEEYSNVHYH